MYSMPELNKCSYDRAVSEEKVNSHYVRSTGVKRKNDHCSNISFVF